MPLQDLVTAEKPLPLSFEKCVEFIEDTGLCTEGLYSVSGNKIDQDNIQKQFDQDHNINLVSMEVTVNAVAGALKAFFADLPDPLIPYSRDPELLEAAKIPDKTERLHVLKEIVKKFHHVNYDVFCYVITHLNRQPNETSFELKYCLYVYGFLVEETAPVVWRVLMVMSAIEKLLRQADMCRVKGTAVRSAFDVLVSYSSPHFAETFNRKSRDMHICIARCHVARNRFFQILQREQYVTQKYQENAQLSVQQLRYLRSRITELQDQIKRVEPCDDSSNIQGKIQKVRSLWTSMNETLMFLEKEKEVVSSVLSAVDQYALDGTNIVINVPRLLVERIEKQICELQIGNIHEAGKLNLLTIIQLLNEVLKVMKYEHCKADQPRLTTDLHSLGRELQLQRESLSHMKHLRHKIKENTTAMRDSISEKEEEWHRKWKEYLGLSPFSLITDWTTVVDLLPPMPPLSFDPASEEAYQKSILSQYPASLPDPHNENIQEDVCRSGDLSALATS